MHKVSAFSACDPARSRCRNGRLTQHRGAADVQKSAEPPYPAKPIRIISPLASGGSGDALARMVGETLADTLGQPVVIDNRPGANGIIGVDLVAKATPDGYTLLVASGGNVAINPALYGAKLPFNVERDLIPLTQIATQSFVAHVSPGFPATSIKALIVIAKAKPDSINFASAGAGSTAHLMAVLFESMTGARMTRSLQRRRPRPGCSDVPRVRPDVRRPACDPAADQGGQAARQGVCGDTFESGARHPDNLRGLASPATRPERVVWNVRAARHTAADSRKTVRRP